jgi:hypothetical protein
MPPLSLSFRDTAAANGFSGVMTERVGTLSLSLNLDDLTLRQYNDFLEFLPNSFIGLEMHMEETGRLFYGDEAGFNCGEEPVWFCVPGYPEELPSEENWEAFLQRAYDLRFKLFPKAGTPVYPDGLCEPSPLGLPRSLEASFV